MLKKFKISLSSSQIGVLLRRWGYRWRRVRKSLKNQRDECLFRFFQQEIVELIKMSELGEIDLYSYDEASVNLNPSVFNSWLKKKSQICLPAQRGKSITLAAFFSRDNKIEPYEIQGAMNAESFIQITEEFLNYVTKKTIVILDNASFHRSAKVKIKMEEWKKKNLYFQFIPAYCPELNWIEILWHHIKHVWLKIEDFQSFETLKKAVKNILSNIGSTYLINFS